MDGKRLADMYYAMLNGGATAAEMATWVETLSHPERRDLRAALEVSGCRQLIRSLYYDYKQQVWI